MYLYQSMSLPIYLPFKHGSLHTPGLYPLRANKEEREVVIGMIARREVKGEEERRGGTLSSWPNKELCPRYLKNSCL
jgi:hypothetical protein